MKHRNPDSNGEVILYQAPGGRRLSEAALVALTLMIAESHSQEKEVLVRIVMHLLLGEETP
ncbi:MAG TPA: hypothetical protein PKI62_06450 [bacterium]|nr:hypothetical protein [bacterium]HPR89640.1 hypothetical protein [bacterium]